MLRYRLNVVAVHRRSEPDEPCITGHAKPDFFFSLASAPK